VYKIYISDFLHFEKYQNYAVL